MRSLLLAAQEKFGDEAQVCLVVWDPSCNGEIVDQDSFMAGVQLSAPIWADSTPDAVVDFAIQAVRQFP